MTVTPQPNERMDIGNKGKLAKNKRMLNIKALDIEKNYKSENPCRI